MWFCACQCVCVYTRACMCVSNVLLMGERPRGRGKVILPRGKLIQRNLSSMQSPPWILFPGTGALLCSSVPTSPLLSIRSSFRPAFRMRLQNSPLSLGPLNTFSPINPQAGAFSQGASTPSSGHTGNHQGSGSQPLPSDASPHFPSARTSVCNGLVQW